jgi:glycosyltransferase involved in cell wall biosynthesis
MNPVPPEADSTRLGVCVVLPTFNRRDETARAIRSVLEQTRAADEIVVVDDGSTDGTKELIESRFGTRVRYLRQENRGPSAARNVGIASARSPLIAFLDSDDTWMPEKLELQLPLMEDPKIVLSYTNSIDSAAPDQDLFSRNGLVFETPRIEIPLRVLIRERLSGALLPTWICRRSAILEAGGFDEEVAVAEDTRLLFRLALAGPFAVLTAPMLERGYTPDGPQLTRPGDAQYERDVAQNMLELLLETHTNRGACPPDVTRRLRGAIGHYLCVQSEQCATEGDTRGARRKAREAFSFATGKTKLKALIGFAAPQLLGKRAALKANRSE